MWDSRSPPATYSVQQLEPNYLHHIMHTNHPTNQQPAHTHSALATLVFFMYFIIFEYIMKTNKNTFSKMVAGWIVDWLNEYPPPSTRGYWKSKPNHNTMKPWRRGEAV